ncbi:MAG TPA: hypothetical protein VJN95_14595 [Gemmatimonadales bacterium]|nr:hypothetical protein [Gemmatimonadales bacterium]
MKITGYKSPGRREDRKIRVWIPKPGQSFRAPDQELRRTVNADRRAQGLPELSGRQWVRCRKQMQREEVAHQRHAAEARRRREAEFAAVRELAAQAGAE